MKHLSEVPDPPSDLRPEISHDLDAVVMRALAKDPDQRYASAEEMDADLARVARGASVSQRTTEAMTQVLAGGATAGSQTIVARPRRPPSPRRRRRRTGRPPTTTTGPAAARSGRTCSACSRSAIAAGGGYLVYDKIQTQIDSNRTIAVPDVGQLTRNNAVIQIRDQGLRVRVVHLSSDTIPVGSVTGQNPGAGDRVAKDTTVTITVSTGKPKVQVPFRDGAPGGAGGLELGNRGLKADQHSVYSPKADAGTVTAESPAGGTLVLKGSIVRINVSQGPQPARGAERRRAAVRERQERARGARLHASRRARSTHRRRSTR